MTIHDTTLIPALQEGKSDAFEAVYHHFIKPVLHYVNQIINDRGAAEDIAVETFTRAFQKNTDFASVDKLKGFLFITAGNAARDFLRREKRTVKIMEGARWNAALEEQSIEVAYLRTETARALREAVDRVPGKPGQVVRLLFLEGKTMPEVAAELQLSYHTIKNHRAKGLEVVRDYLVNNKLLSVEALLLALYFIEPK